LTKTSSRQPGAYRPYTAARRPGGRPDERPKFRVLVHSQFLDEWNGLAERLPEKTQQFWDHVAFTPGAIPKIGTSSMMRGKYSVPKWSGYSGTVHYEISGAGRINYQYNAASTEGAEGDPHGVVKILSIDLGSH